MDNLEVLLFILFSFLARVFCECPDVKAIQPCTCGEENDIICGGDDDIDLAKIFQTLTKTSELKQKHYDRFTLSNTKVTAIPDNVFQDITFGNIIIENTNLVTIDSTTVMATNNVTKYLTIRNNHALTQVSILNFMKKFISVIDMAENNNPLFTEVPAAAFTSLHQNHLDELGLYSPRKIGNFAFRHMSALTLIAFANNIDHISQNAFTFDVQSSEVLNIELGKVHLKMENISPGAFSDIKRPTTINLSRNPDITYLSEGVFHDLLKNDLKNTIDVKDNPIDCEDCRTYWVTQTALKWQFLHITCSDGKPFDDPDHFKKCRSY